MKTKNKNRLLRWSECAVFFGILIGYLGGCSMPNNGIPVYIQIDSMSVQTNQATQGSASSKITDAWLFVNGEQIGVFELPTKVPVLKSGDLRVSIEAGIKDNGIANTRAAYPFYADDTFTIANAQSAQTYVREPKVRYINGADFPLIEDFEATNRFTSVTAETDNVFEGNRSGEIILSSPDSTVTAYTTNPFLIPNAGLSNVYVELNYMSDCFFECGMMVYTTSGTFTQLYKITFAPHAAWNKTYLNFSGDLASVPSGSNFRLYFTVSKLSSDANSYHVWLDNIKVVEQ